MNDFKVSLTNLYEHLRDQMRSRWDRDLPMFELLFDRWERANSLGFGSGTSVYHNCYIYGRVKIGKNTWIGPNTLLDGSGGLTIGNNCSISAGVQIYTHDTVNWAVSGGRADYEYASVDIGNNCYIGPSAVITKGIQIGDHSIIGACSLVNKNIHPFSIATGVPCRIIGEVAINDQGEVYRIINIS